MPLTNAWTSVLLYHSNPSDPTWQYTNLSSTRTQWHNCSFVWRVSHLLTKCDYFPMTVHPLQFHARRNFSLSIWSLSKLTLLFLVFFPPTLTICVFVFLLPSHECQDSTPHLVSFELQKLLKMPIKIANFFPFPSQKSPSHLSLIQALLDFNISCICLWFLSLVLTLLPFWSLSSWSLLVQSLKRCIYTASRSSLCLALVDSVPH